MERLGRAAEAPACFDDGAGHQGNLAGRPGRAAARAGSVGGIAAAGGNQGLKISVAGAADIFIEWYRRTSGMKRAGIIPDGYGSPSGRISNWLPQGSRT